VSLLTISRGHVPGDPRPSAFEVIRSVAARHGLSPDDIRGHCRRRELVSARYEAMWQLCQATRPDGRPWLSLPAIARAFDHRDHTTVLYGIRKHAEKVGQA
jgi:chromosomal replication initiator protein